MNQAKINRAALSHAYAYAIEILTDRGHDHDWVYNRVPYPKSLRELLANIELEYSRADIKEFYAAMQKVVPNIAYPEHGGTECRGWYRVWGDIVKGTGYWCEFDMGRDNGMAWDLYQYGAITKSQHDLYRSKTTLRIALSRLDGRTESIGDITTQFKPEWVKRCLDTNLLYALELAQQPQMQTMAALKY